MLLQIERLGKGLQLAELQALHMAAIKDNSIIDYAALYGLSEQDSLAGEEGSPNSQVWQFDQIPDQFTPFSNSTCATDGDTSKH